MDKIIFATKNLGKLNEFKKLIRKFNLKLEVISLNQLDNSPEIIENGKTFHENAYIKAKTIYEKYKIPVVADDSGLIVKSLGNEPGVYSSRYAGENATDEENNIKLIEKVRNLPNREAYFQCVICYINKFGKVFYSEGKCEGEIILEPKGENGFGYDPIFYIPELKKTMAELDIDTKNKISHRAKAFEKLIDILKKDLSVYLSFVIPVYNEKENVSILHEKIRRVIDEKLKFKCEIIFVDDGSYDGSLEELKKLKEKDDEVKIISFKENRGQSAALSAGFEYAKGELVVTMDADLQNDPEDIPDMLKFIPEYDVVAGIRAKRQDNFIRKIASKIGNGIRNWVTKDNIIDTGCSLKIYKTKFLRKIKMFKGMHRFLPTLLKLEGAKIIQVKVKHHPRIYGKSKYGFGITSRMFKAFIDLLAVRWMISRHIDYEIKEIIE